MRNHSKSPARPSLTSAVVFGKENVILSENAETWNRVNKFVHAYNQNFPTASVQLKSLTPQEHNSRWLILPFTASRLADHGMLEGMLSEQLGKADVHISSTTEIVSGGKLATLMSFNVDKSTVDSNRPPPKSRSRFDYWLAGLLVFAAFAWLGYRASELLAIF